MPPKQRLLYVRLSGKTHWYRHDYSVEELRLWLERIHTSGAEESWVYFNNDREGFAIKNALMLRRMLRAEGKARKSETQLGQSVLLAK